MRTFPSTIISSTNLPSTILSQSTRAPATTYEPTSTEILTNPSTLQHSTSIIPSVLSPINTPCYYITENCENCRNISLNLDPHELNITCSFISGEWNYSFKPKYNDTVSIDKNIQINEKPLIINGNLIQSSKSTFSLKLSEKKKNRPFLFINGSVYLNGFIDLLLDERPFFNGNDSYFLLSFNSSKLF